MAIIVKVFPGYIFDECSFGLDELNRAAVPTVLLEGFVGEADIGDGSVTRCKLGVSPFFWAEATGGPGAYLGALCAGITATNLVDGIWSVWKAPVDCAAGATFKLGDTAAKNLLIDGRNVGARYVRAGQLVVVQYNSTKDGWEIHNINPPMPFEVGLATKVTQGAPGVLPAPPAGSEYVFTSRRGWTRLSELYSFGLNSYKEFLSPDFLSSYVPSGAPVGGFVVLHGFGAVPRIVETTLVCMAGDVGYEVGDEVEFSDLTHEAGDDVHAASTWRNVAEIGTRFYDSTSHASLRIFNKTNGAYAVIAPSKWKIKYRAWV